MFENGLTTETTLNGCDHFLSTIYFARLDVYELAKCDLLSLLCPSSSCMYESWRSEFIKFTIE